MNRRSFFKLVGAAVVAAQLPPPIESLMEALESGNYNAAPTVLTSRCEYLVKDAPVYRMVLLDIRQPRRSVIIVNLT